MKINVNKEACIGCGACAAICDEVFELDDDGLSTAKVKEVPEKNEQEVRDAADACPTGAVEVQD